MRLEFHVVRPMEMKIELPLVDVKKNRAIFKLSLEIILRRTRFKPYRLKRFPAQCDEVHMAIPRSQEYFKVYLVLFS